ncbi:MAG: hypothetical protein REI11_08205 [Patulibacter sp.]|nr:hypothetical protein [Patulibacter sp.]
MTESGPTSGEDSCREELIAWLDAHSHWPVEARLETPAGDLVASMTGRLAPGPLAEIYAVATDDDALRFAVPTCIRAVRIDGARSASFERVDLPIALTIAVVSLAHEVA